MAIEETITEAIATAISIVIDCILKKMGFSALEIKKIEKVIQWLIIGTLASLLIGITIAYS